MGYEGKGEEEMPSYPADPTLDPSSAMPYAVLGSASTRKNHHQIRLPKMPDPAMFDGTIKGLDAREWLDTIQSYIFWDFNMPHAPHLQVTYAVSRLQGEQRDGLIMHLGNAMAGQVLVCLLRHSGQHSCTVM